ncbi:F-box/kelch-repeat protein At3g23880-like [Trifolium pratense]|uniref:F-box/kelch-repeat protein At3g23880-like n=1 Tax=Trifolium pratense TaxID=57577 RepID=UPI001E693BE5|nr:F-box/kelch-repeat protein At3g23880-like [Trifolium pratense]
MDIPPPSCITYDLITEILLLLSVKTMMRLKSVSKSWNTLISDPTFIEQHLKKSLQNPQLILISDPSSGVVSFPMDRLLQNPSSTDSCLSFPMHRLLQNPSSTDSCLFRGSMNNCQVIGSYNGLLCLLFKENGWEYQEYQFVLWNPATGTISLKVGTLKDSSAGSPFKFTFGCDISTGTYKVVALAKKCKELEVRVFSFGGSDWKNIQSFPIKDHEINDGVHLSGTINWLALSKYMQQFNQYGWISNHIIVNAKQSVIFSLNLSTETYTQILLPSGLDEVSMSFPPTLGVLTDCLCFLHDWKPTQCVIWLMKEFGVQESWTQLFRMDYCKINHHHPYLLGFSICPLRPLYLSKDEDTLIFAEYINDLAIIYSKRDMRVERIRNSHKMYWFTAMNYVESLVSTV